VIAFATAVATCAGAAEAAREAARRAVESLGTAPALTMAFTSSYDDVGDVPAALRCEVCAGPIVGGSVAGAIFAGGEVSEQGVLVCVLGGEGVRASTVEAPVGGSDSLEVVPAAAQVHDEADRAAAAGFGEALCLAFCPGVRVDGETFAAAIRKGTGARIQLAGALTGDDAGPTAPVIFAGDRVHTDRVVLSGIFTRTSAGVVARHGCRAVGPARVVTRSDGPWLMELDGLPALDVWLADARDAGFRPSSGGEPLHVQLAHRNALGLDVQSHVEPIVRAPVGLRHDGAVSLAAGIPEGTRVRVMQASPADMLDASAWAGRVARERAGGRCAGAVVFASESRRAALGDRFDEEASLIARAVEAPVAGACVRGELARAHREIDAFHNATAVVLAWPGRAGRSGVSSELSLRSSLRT